MDDLINDLADDVQENQSSRIHRERRSSLYTISQGKILLFGGAGLLVLIILVVLLFLGGRGAPSEDLSLIQARLTQMEARIKATIAMENRLQEFEEKDKDRQTVIVIMTDALDDPPPHRRKYKINIKDVTSEYKGKEKDWFIFFVNLGILKKNKRLQEVQKELQKK